MQVFKLDGNLLEILDLGVNLKEAKKTVKIPENLDANQKYSKINPNKPPEKKCVNCEKWTKKPSYKFCGKNCGEIWKYLYHKITEEEADKRREIS